MAAVRRRALCFGLNYPGTHAELRGCVNDALDWSEVLGRRGYDVEVRLNDKATLRAMRESIALLTAGARWGDRLVLTYSGHGTNLRDRDGDEPDGRDEAWVAHDMNVLTDDELHTLMQVPRGVRLTVISDSCHSGTMARLHGRTHYAGDPLAGARPRFLPPEALSVGTVTQGPKSSATSRAMLLSGCADNEVSYDALIGGRYRGAMTAAALAALPAATSMKDWHRRTLAGIAHPQTPQLTATRYQGLLKPLA